MKKELEFLVWNLLGSKDPKWLYDLVEEFMQNEREIGSDKAEEILYTEIHDRLERSKNV